MNKVVRDKNCTTDFVKKKKTNRRKIMKIHKLLTYRSISMVGSRLVAQRCCFDLIFDSCILHDIFFETLLLIT